MNKKEVTEIKRRFKKESCTITRVCGCYVDAGKEKVTQFGSTFLNLEDEEFHKYLEIVNKCLSGTDSYNSAIDNRYDIRIRTCQRISWRISIGWFVCKGQCLDLSRSQRERRF
ncbi:MAG: DUF4317 family protein [Lachnospiraceae bacterium]|nr:DUF4317 family protein [Lachnospiraceae bacterium]